MTCAGRVLQYILLSLTILFIIVRPSIFYDRFLLLSGWRCTLFLLFFFPFSVILIVVSVCTATGAWNWLIDPDTQKVKG